MALPQLTPEQRLAALEKAAASRRERAEVKNRLIIEDCRHMAGDPFDPMDFSTRYYAMKTRRRTSTASTSFA